MSNRRRLAATLTAFGPLAPVLLQLFFFGHGLGLPTVLGALLAVFAQTGEFLRPGEEIRIGQLRSAFLGLTRKLARDVLDLARHILSLLRYDVPDRARHGEQKPRASRPAAASRPFALRGIGDVSNTLGDVGDLLRDLVEVTISP